MEKNIILEDIKCCVCDNTDINKFSIKYEKDNFIVVECNNCSFNFIPPYFSKRISYSNYKDEEVLEQVRKGNDWLKVQRHLLRFKLIKKYQKTGRLFDLGVGWGHFLYAGKQLGYGVYGIEVSEMPYNYAKHDLKLPVDLIDFFDMDIKDKAYDIITLWDVLEHIPDADKALRRCNKMMKDKGYIFIQVPQIDSIIAKKQKVNWKMIGENHVNLFSRMTICRLLEKEGFKMVKIKSSFEFKLFLMYTVLPWIKGNKSKSKQSNEMNNTTESDRQEYFNKKVNLPRWVLKIIMFLHNLVYNTLSFLNIGEEMIVVAQKIK